jgi:hypothetical protein
MLRDFGEWLPIAVSVLSRRPLNGASEMKAQTPS